MFLFGVVSEYHTKKEENTNLLFLSSGSGISMICILPLADLKKTTVPLQSLISPYLTMNGGKFRKVGFLLYSISDLSFSYIFFD